MTREPRDWEQYLRQQDRWDRHVAVAMAFAAVAVIVLLLSEHWDTIQTYLPN
jgi:sulfur relay (sulfurtransferase) DsrC/TusE family protein